MNISGSELTLQISIKLMRIRRIELIWSDWDLRNFWSEVLHFNCICDSVFVYIFSFWAISGNHYVKSHMRKATHHFVQCSLFVSQKIWLCLRYLNARTQFDVFLLNVRLQIFINIYFAGPSMLTEQSLSVSECSARVEWTDEGSSEPGWWSSWRPHCEIVLQIKNHF